MPAESEIQTSVPTRSSFIASWDKVSGAAGYRLDVSTNNTFSSYVSGYHDLDVGNVDGEAVTGLNPGTTYYYRVRPYRATGPGRYSSVISVTTAAPTGLIINPAFDSSITNNSNAAAIEAMINRAISICESLFDDPITVQILFRYATTLPNGTPLPQGFISASDWVYYGVPWGTFYDALIGDATTNNDRLANASLPGGALSVNLTPSSAGGRAVGLDTPPAMFPNGTVGQGGPYDGIVTLKSTLPWQFTRPVNATNYDAQRSTEHEIDEVLGLGSFLTLGGTDLRPQDLFSWSSAGVRNLTSSGTRYFSIDGGATDIVNFNQNSNGDFGDWFGGSCPQAHPYVQNAFNCVGQSSDVSVTTPEGINLDVIGYDLITPPTPAPNQYDFNGDGHPDYVLYNGGTRGTAIWYLNNNVYMGGALGPAVPAGWVLIDTADFNGDGHPDYALFNPGTHATAIWYLNNNVYVSAAYGPTAPSGWALVAVADFNGDGKPDYVLYNPGTHQTAIWYLNNNVYLSGGYGPTLPAGWQVAGTADFNRDGKSDYLLFNPSSRQSAIWYMSGRARIGAAYGPPIVTGYQLIGAADFNGDTKPDYALFNPSTRRTAIWYLNNNVYVSGAYGPMLPVGWSLVAP